MKNVNQLMQEIISISSTIESDYPELYKYLDETPFKICETNKNEICISDLEEYLKTLKEQLKDYISSHNKINGIK
ncbi:MAG: hypothetical protein LCH58_01180 [Bacteroidetes bacterium]|jgi:Na+/phosphate symporter|uniref:hypothetical protein n=1 Tax=Phnomibacter sp. TaxID=2836217 RepID=UPI002FDDC6A3|nr:hypothetical protein [Bacteroidota bacterium]